MLSCKRVFLNLHMAEWLGKGIGYNIADIICKYLMFSIYLGDVPCKGLYFVITTP